MRIRSSMLALTLSLAALATAPAFAAAAKPMTAQQQKMADCSHQSKGMKGDAHKTFMSNCLKGKSDMAATPAAMPAAMPTATAPMAASGGKMSQQDKMKTCNATAKTKALKGTERKAFMSTCLKG